VPLHTAKLLTPEEFASLIEFALTTRAPQIPTSHLARLIALGYITVTAKGPVVTGGGRAKMPNDPG
jgi:hypothetical protein